MEVGVAKCSIQPRYIFNCRTVIANVFSLFLLWGSTCSLCMPVLRPVSQAGPVHNPRDGTSVVYTVV